MGPNMALADFLTRLDELLIRADALERPGGKPEENTKGNLLMPLLEAFGYGPDELTFEGAIKTLTSEWVDSDCRPYLRFRVVFAGCV